MVTRDMGPVEYVDRASRDDLLAAYEGHEVDARRIPQIDHVWGEQSLLECVGGGRDYDYVLASHVIEHVPDLFGWLGEIAFGKEAMGQGDITLMAMIGAMVGPSRSILTIFLAAGIGAVVFLLIVLPIGALRAKRAGTEFEPPLVPFGVFLAPAGMVALLWGDQVLRAYLNIAGL
jgi:leader peptidase (prepilin peptidase)/N-methyltransferase